jgi:ketosteroid isomerase-like protein
MSEENVEIVRRLYDAVARRDAATVLSLYDPEVEWDGTRSPLGNLTGELFYHGHAGIRRMSRYWQEAWETIEYEIEELIDAGDQVISVLTYRTRGRVSGADVEQTDYPVWTIKEGKIIRVVWLPTRAEALEAAGLGEEGMSEKNAEIIRAVYERWSDGDFSTSADLFDPHVVLVLSGDFGPDSVAHHGAEAIAIYTRDSVLSPSSRVTMEAEKIVSAGDSVLVDVRQRAVGRTSGVETELVFFTLWSFRGSKVIRIESFRERAEALEAAGLGE